MQANIVWGTKGKPDMLIDKGHRLQISVDHILVAEAVFETYDEAERARDAWNMLRYNRGLPMGGSVINRIDIPKLWDVKVGETIQ